MGTIKDWLKDTFGTKQSITIDAKTAECLFNLKELIYHKYAQAIVAERYGSLLSQCDFITYVNNEVVEKDTWYRLNVEPNPNQTSSEFMKQLAKRLIFNGEALIIKTDNNNLYVANDFQKGSHQLNETYFNNVQVDIYEDGTVSPYQLTGTFKGENAIYIRYQNADALKYIRQMNDMYTNLINNVRKSGSAAIKYALTIDTTATNGAGIDLDKELSNIINEDFDALVEEGNAIIPLLNGFKLDVLNPANNNSQNATVASSNVNNMFESIMVNVGNIYNVPKSFMIGTYEKNDEDKLLTLGLDPLCSMITEAFNRRYYSKKQVMEKTYCRLDTKKVKHFDILTISDSINKLVSSGVYSINDIRNLLDEPMVDSEIGDKHWITRNYAVVGDYIQEMTNYSDNDPKTQVGKNQQTNNNK